MIRQISRFALAGLIVALLPGLAAATTREIADLQPARLSFDRSILNRLTYETYRDPFDELQTRPYNLLFNNIGRHPNLSPWQGQQGSYTRYLNALIGNNGAANVDNDADAIQGSLVRRETPSWAWGVSASLLSGTDDSNDSAGTIVFEDTDAVTGFDLRAGSAHQISERHVLGAGIRLTQATSELQNSSFEPGVGGALGVNDFEQFGVTFDLGMRRFITPSSSWEIQGLAGFGSSERNLLSDTLDSAGAVTARSVVTNYDITDLSLGVVAGYNRLKSGRRGETEYRAGVERTQRELDNSDLAFNEAVGVVTPTLTLLGQDTIATNRLHVSAKSIFQAGETEMFTGANLGYSRVEGATQVDSVGTVVNETVDDSQIHLGLTVGLRQPLFGDRFRFIISGHADLLDEERGTIFDAASDRDSSTLSTSQYAIGIEGVLANVTFDIAWLLGEEAPVVPVALGLPSGSRRAVVVDRLIFSAAVAW